MAAYFTVNTTKLNGPWNYTTPRDVTAMRFFCRMAKPSTRGRLGAVGLDL